MLLLLLLVRSANYQNRESQILGLPDPKILSENPGCHA